MGPYAELWYAAVPCDEWNPEAMANSNFAEQVVSTGKMALCPNITSLDLINNPSLNGGGKIMSLVINFCDVANSKLNTSVACEPD